MVFLIPLTPIYHKLPYDKANVPVKRINAFHNLFVSDVQIEKAGESEHLSDISLDSHVYKCDLTHQSC